MKNKKMIKNIAIVIVVILLISAVAAVLVMQKPSDEKTFEETIILPDGVKLFTKTYTFSEPIIEENQGLTIVNVLEADFHSTGDGRPVVPVNLTTLTFPFGTKILSVDYKFTTPKEINVESKLSYGSCSVLTEDDKKIYENSDMYPSEFVVYHTGGGLSENEYKTMLNIRVYPVTYIPLVKQLLFTDEVQINVFYKEPETPLITDKNEYDLLIIAPNDFSKNLQPLIDHKEKQNIKTKFMTAEEIYEKFDGRDEAEQIKYCIKESIERYGIKNVLLVGGRDGQSNKWNLPVRYSHVIIRKGTQENIEPEFLSDLYFADIYDSEGNFSCWDSNENGIFAEYDGGVIDKMDLYPDVRLGRLACRNKIQVKTVVDKIINYETNDAGDWFKNMVLVSGDHWQDKNQINEGVLIMDAAKEIMSDFKPVELYATEKGDMTIRDVTNALNQGAGFAYFCGHGGVSAWGIHLPPNAEGWAPKIAKWLPDSLIPTSFYRNIHMNLLRNKYKLPVTVVGGCLNGKFDVTLSDGGALSCWAWKLTSKKGGGAIATIANTGLGTHAMDDSDNNGVNDYLEAYDGWIELRFFELYKEENIRMLGELHQEAITQYLNRFLGNHDEMDMKMVQQWQLFGDSSLQVN
jgi:hypothetical protein